MEAKIPKIGNSQFIPVDAQLRMIEKANQQAKERRETRRFIITTTIGAIAAVASVVAATASVISCLR